MQVIPSTDSDFKKYITEHSKVVVKFYADWCGSCKLFAPKYKRIAAEEAFQDLFFLEVNAEENEETRKMAGVDNLPFFASFSNGKLLEGSAGSKEELLRKMISSLQQN